MTRVSIVVSMWLVMTGGIGDAVLAGSGARWPLLALELAVSALTAVALWVALDGPPDGDDPGRGRHLYD